jgi:hypothetical protein
MASPIVSISEDGNEIWLGRHRFSPQEEVPDSLLQIMRPELHELKSGESRALQVAMAICEMHQKAISACLAEDQPLNQEGTRK